jgi:hypothetical protein
MKKAVSYFAIDDFIACQKEQALLLVAKIRILMLNF